MQTHRPLQQGWPSRSQTGRRAGLLCLWEEAAHSHLLGSLACGHEQRCCLPSARWGLSEGPSMFPPSSPIFQPPSSLIRDAWPVLGGVMERSFQPRWPARPSSQPLLQGCSSYQHSGDDKGPVRQRVGDVRASASGNLRDVKPLGRTPHPNLDGQTDGEQEAESVVSPSFLHASNLLVSFPSFMSIVIANVFRANISGNPAASLLPRGSPQGVQSPEFCHLPNC